MGQEQPLVEFELDYRFVIKPGKNLARFGAKKNVIRRVRVTGKDGTQELLKRDETPEHKLSLPSTTLILVDRMFSEGRIDSHFDSDYVYIKRDLKSSGGEVYYSIAPVKATLDGPVRHITPAFLFREYQDKSPFDLYFDIDILATRLKDKKDATDPLRKAGFVRTKITLTRFDRDGADRSLDLSFRMEVSFYRYFWGETVRLLPLPPLLEPGALPEHGVLLGIEDAWWTGDEEGKATSPVEKTSAFLSSKLWDTLESLNFIMHSDKQRVLIRGEPGSGKEVYSNPIHFGAVRQKDDKAGMNARSVATMTGDQLRELLYGRYVNGVLIPGMISKAEGGTLFLDEFDKIADPSTYAELLRVLEAGEYVPIEGPEVKKFKNVNWIFAGAFSGAGTSNPETALPADFWSRLTAQIDVINPLRYLPVELSLTGKKMTVSYAGAAFAYFYLRYAIEFAGGVSQFLQKNALTFQARYAQALYYGTNRPGTEMGVQFFKNVDDFQKGVHNGVYCKIYKVTEEGQKSATDYWT